MITVRELHDTADALAITALMADVWQVPSAESPVDPSTLIALAHSGSYVALAELDGELAGAAVGFLSLTGSASGGDRGLHSHITGVGPSWAGRGVGRALKLHQRDWCLARGLSGISWTFDPLVARNAHFNLNRLGARAVDYLPDFYGTMPDGLNLDQPTDRLLVRWDLTAGTTSTPSIQTVTGATITVLSEQHGRPQLDLGALDRAAPDDVADPGIRCLVGIPDDIEAIRRVEPPLSLGWRLALRAAMTTLLALGWQITDVERGVGYTLRKADR